MDDGNGPATQGRFRANLVTPRTVLVFVAGFGLALLLARLLPGNEIFHPETQSHTIDTVITIASVSDGGRFMAIGTRSGLGFGTTNDVWDGQLFDEVRAQAGNAMTIPARITYVVPKEGVVSAVFIRAPE